MENFIEEKLKVLLKINLFEMWLRFYHITENEPIVYIIPKKLVLEDENLTLFAKEIDGKEVTVANVRKGICTVFGCTEESLQSSESGQELLNIIAMEEYEEWLNTFYSKVDEREKDLDNIEEMKSFAYWLREFVV